MQWPIELRTVYLRCEYEGTMNRTLWPLFCLFAVAASSSHTWAAIVLPNLPAGTQYQLIFVTAGMRDATSSSIADYNAFVASQAALNPTLPSTTWHAVGSTATVNAKDNAPSIGLPVYNTRGELVASPATGLYTTTLLNPISFDQYGNSNGLEGLDDGANVASQVWTGSTAAGTKAAGAYLGYLPVTIFGGRHTTNDDWVFLAAQNPTAYPQNKSLYALSEPLTAMVPEPASLTVWSLLVLLVSGLGLRQRCKGTLSIQ